MDIIKALEVYNRNISGTWSVGEEYASLQWFGTEETKPSQEILQECWDQYVFEREKNKYKDLRAADYPPVVDQLDLIFNGGIDGWRAVIQAVKDKYPKPE